MSYDFLLSVLEEDRQERRDLEKISIWKEILGTKESGMDGLLKKVLYEFEKYMTEKTNIHSSQGGFVHAKLISETSENYYIDLVWGVDNALEHDENVETCYLPKMAFREVDGEAPLPKDIMRSIRYVGKEATHEQRTRKTTDKRANRKNG